MALAQTPSATVDLCNVNNLAAFANFEGHCPLTKLLADTDHQLAGRLEPSCRDHEGGGGVKFQQWDGKQWNAISDWIATDQALVRPLVEAAAKYAQEKGITPRTCP
jgi:hypothetical protein